MAAVELFESLVEQIFNIDEVLNTEEDAKASGRRKIVNDLVSDQETVVTPVASSLIEKMEGVPTDALPGIYLGLIRKLEKHFAKRVTEMVDKLVPSPTEAAEPKEEISDEHRTALLESRKDLLEKARVIGDLAVKTDELSEEDYEAKLPKRRNVAGKRGKRAISWFTLSVGDTNYDSIAEVAKANGYEKAAELTKAIRDSGTNLTHPPKSFSFQMKNGNVLEAVDTRTEDEREDDEEDSTEEDSE
jgi:hypothetical protein